MWGADLTTAVATSVAVGTATSDDGSFRSLSASAD